MFFNEELLIWNTALSSHTKSIRISFDGYFSSVSFSPRKNPPNFCVTVFNYRDDGPLLRTRLFKPAVVRTKACSQRNRFRCIMRLVHRSCTELRRVCTPARTGSNRQYSHFRRNLSAPVDLLLRRGSAGYPRHGAVFRGNQEVTC